MEYQAFLPGTILELDKPWGSPSGHIVVLSNRRQTERSGQMIGCAFDASANRGHKPEGPWLRGRTVAANGLNGNVIAADISRFSMPDLTPVPVARLKREDLCALQHAQQQEIICSALWNVLDEDYGIHRDEIKTGQTAMTWWKHGHNDGKRWPVTVIERLNDNIYLCCRQTSRDGISSIPVKYTRSGANNYIRYECLDSLPAENLTPLNDFLIKDDMIQVLRAASDMLSGIWRPEKMYRVDGPQLRYEPS